jgi:uncharacterized OsmC-like protein
MYNRETMPEQRQLEYTVNVHRIDAHGNTARCKNAEILLDTDMSGRADVFNPVELLLAALSACMIKGIERVAPMIGFQYRGLLVHLHGIRQYVPPRMSHNNYEITVDTDELDHRLELLHGNVRRFGTVFNTVAPGKELEGTVQKAAKSRLVE